ncbi:MAG: hypothetical protein E5Y06_33255 [Mesorhizobium sp.]|nr:hypothetical protein EN845_32850 [Mesorhizobium sp. M8A.F.Ca.ET.202.01.1.1]TGR40200.1 hypothetical protein EN841_32750 [Mesorhizobium sp. M8A.F.Ca.ET.198.01.1.1]TIN90316.1 MAG: hypothetical protein E5Y06_33255 [Mesorhizobium sp.]
MSTAREECGPRRYPHFAKGSEVSTGRLGALSLAQPTARRPRQRFKVPSVRKVVPLETRKRRSSDRSLRSTLAICSGIGFRSLASTVAAEHELAGLVSFDYGQRA